MQTNSRRMSKMMNLITCAQYVSAIKMKLFCHNADMHFVTPALLTGIVNKKKNKRVLYVFKKWI